MRFTPAGKSKVVLFLPNLRWNGKRSWMYVPYTALILTALLKERFDFTIFDGNVDDLSEEECVNRLAAFDPAIVLVSGLSTEYYRTYCAALDVARRAAPSAVLVFGGVFPTLMPEESLEIPEVDWIFMGHAEERAPSFLDMLFAGDAAGLAACQGIGRKTADGRAEVNQCVGGIFTIKALPRPDYSMLDVGRYLNEPKTDYNLISKEGATAVLLTSFGCPYSCSFCAARSINGRGIKFRPADDVLEEMTYLRETHGIRSFSFFDECFLADRNRTIEILNAFIERDWNITWKLPNASAWHLSDDMLELMKRSGCSQVTISVESGSPRVLRDIIHKPMKLDIVPAVVAKCKELGIDVLANFVIGLPGETWAELRETFHFAEQADFDFVAFHIATPYPRTELYDIARNQGLLPDDFHFLDDRYWGTSWGFITTDQFTPQELMILRAFEWDRINFATPAKTAKIADLMNISVEELDHFRRETRRRCGIFSPEAAHAKVEAAA